MTKERWKLLMDEDSIELTEEEISEGWHFCWEWDGLLVGPGMKEIEVCNCQKKNDNSRCRFDDDASWLRAHSIRSRL